MPLARGMRARWRPLLAGTMLTVAGFILRDGWASIVLLPGLLLLLSAPLIPARCQDDLTRRAELERELAGYWTPAQRRDLEAILDRYPDDVTGELRDILIAQRLAARNGQFPATGRY